tara:strand:- start:574 stop:1074 length:501 start_codon:yes stop_codon:yes gene_type:complete
MAKITLQGNPINTSGELPKVGTSAPNFTLVDSDLNNVSLETYKGFKKILNIVPSLDTPVCQKSTKEFNARIESMSNTVALVITADLPFAMKRFCSTESLDTIKPLSMMRSRNFAKDYGVLITDGPLEGITARAVVVIDEKNEVLYTELVQEIANEPNYDGAIQAVS